MKGYPASRATVGILKNSSDCVVLKPKTMKKYASLRLVGEHPNPV